jgi:hypothetical protein
LVIPTKLGKLNQMSPSFDFSYNSASPAIKAYTTSNTTSKGITSIQRSRVPGT